jgi:hypothetical protein
MSSKSQKPLPLSDTLRDLALLRTSDLDLLSLVPGSTKTDPPTEASQSKKADIDACVEKSYEFAREARSAIKILNRGDVDRLGEKLEELRSQLEDVKEGLSKS